MSISSDSRRCITGFIHEPHEDGKISFESSALTSMKKQTILSATFTLLVLLCCESCSRHPYARATIEFGPHDDASSEAAIRALLPPNDPSVTLRPFRNTGLYEIGVYDPDPQIAAKRANELVTEMQAKLKSESGGKPFRIWERAEPPIMPVR